MNQLPTFKTQRHGQFRRSFNRPGLKNCRFDLSPHARELLRKACHSSQLENGNPQGNERSPRPPGTTLKDSLELEGLDSLPKRHPADTKLDGEIPLCREFHARNILSGCNAVLNYFFDPMR